MDELEKQKEDAAIWETVARGADHMRRQYAFYKKGSGSLGSEVSYEVPSYSHALGSGQRNELYAYLSTSGAAPMWGLIDTNKAAGYAFDNDRASNTWGYTNNTVAVANEWLEIDFSSQASPTYKADKIKFYFSGIFNCGVWKAQAYISGAWVDVASIAQLGASATQEIDLTGAIGFTKLRILGVSGNSSWDAYWREVEFSIGGQL
jgi:hypothetical protein